MSSEDMCFLPLTNIIILVDKNISSALHKVPSVHSQYKICISKFQKSLILQSKPIFSVTANYWFEFSDNNIYFHVTNF